MPSYLPRNYKGFHREGRQATSDQRGQTALFREGEMCQSLRSATIGSTRVPRQAGSAQPMRARITTDAATTDTVTGSIGETPKANVLTTRETAHAPAIPAARPKRATSS